MFKTLKYLFIARIYKRAKSSLLLLIGSFVALFLVTFIIDDAISVANGASVYLLLILKWAVVLTLLALMANSFLKIVNIASSPFGESKRVPVMTLGSKSKKDNVLDRERLFTKSDRILQKYTKDL